ncbi:LiaF transmembrane domain-containing protein [Paenibacillus sp.]|uniref:LiaF transmembrane domain-containing protein n=1 Tax=Paenibacillus sp. TaxID=58172 RepID=UPI002D4176A5|nr:hypothetical protein [Paenibacillus sp.]HZG56530.1 hypothetical protein [Paenibacillus sp.]
MKWNRNTGLAAALIAVGVLILLSRVGVDVFGWLVPLAMLGLGYYGIRNGRQTIGWIVLIVGLLALAGKLWALAAFLAPVLLIWFGWTLLKRRKAYEG